MKVKTSANVVVESEIAHKVTRIGVLARVVRVSDESLFEMM